MIVHLIWNILCSVGINKGVPAFVPMPEQKLIRDTISISSTKTFRITEINQNPSQFTWYLFAGLRLDIIRLWQDVIIDHDGYADWNIKASDTYQQDLYERSSQCDSSHSEPLSKGESTCCHGSSHTFISLCQHNDDDHDGVDHDDNDHDDDDKW